MFKTIFFFVLGIASAVLCQDVQFNVIGLDGTARVQRTNERSWKKLQAGNKLSDNDLVETYFQTKAVMQFGRNNVIILGSNSKALLNISVSEESGRRITEISVTLFSGGLFTKAISDCKVNIYTANAVGVMDSGSVTTVAESKTGETGFQALGGKIFVRNIAQQEGLELRSGLTTMIQPAKEPTAPLYITHRHVAVLKHFFGDEYITTELDASGITPTDERGKGRGGRLTEFSTRSRGYVDEGMARSLFNLSRIYGSIISDREMSIRLYTPIFRPVSAVKGKGSVALLSDIGVASEGASVRMVPAASYTLGALDVGVRLSLAQTADGAFSGAFSSFSGILDKVHHVSFASKKDRLSLFLGEVDNMTLGYGLVVNHFSNSSYTNAFQPLGAAGRFRINDELSVQAFTLDCAAPYVNGVYLKYEPSQYHIGTGYIGDVNQYVDMVPSSQRRFVLHPESDSLYPDVGTYMSNVHCYLFDFAVDIVSRYDMSLKLTVEFAKKFTDGYIARMPGFVCDLRNISFGAAAMVESGRMLSSQFGPLYFDRRYTVKSDMRNDFIDSILTPNNRLSRDRKTFGGTLFYRMNPYRGVDVDFEYKQDLTGTKVVEHYVYGSDSTYTTNHPFDYSFRLRVAINDSLFRYLQIAELILQQYHGLLLIEEEASPFPSWTFNARFSAVSIPLFFNLAFETGFDFFYFDSGRRRNNLIDASEDYIFIANAGVRWGIK